MVPRTTEEKLESAMCLLSQHGVPTLDTILDLIIEAASNCGRLECMAAEDLQFNIGQNDRKFYRFGNSGAKFRSILAELYFRCEASCPRRLDGTVYGFEADVFLACPGKEDTHFIIRTSNGQAFPELSMEVQQ